MITALLLAALLSFQPAPAEPPAAGPAGATPAATVPDDEEDWGFPPPAPPVSDADAREAANRAAIERAEQARIEAQGVPRARPRGMLCRETDVGLVCATSERALDDQERRLREQRARDD